MTNFSNISFGAAATQAVAPRVENKAVEKPKTEAEKQQETKENVIKAAGIISIIGVAGLLIAKGIRGKHDASDNKAAQQAVAALPQPKKPLVLALPERATSVATPPTPPKTSAEIVGERVQAAKQQIVNGGNYSKARAAAKHNLDHDQKKAVQQELNTMLSAKRAAEKSAQQHQSELTRTTISANSSMNTAQQKANTVNADTLGDFKAGVKKTVADAQAAAAEKRAAIRSKLENGQKVTRREVKSATIAENKATSAKLKGEKAMEKAEAKAQAQTQAEERKLQSALEYLERTTPEQREAQMVANEQAHIKSLSRKAKQKLSQPRYQRAQADFADARVYSDEKLQKIADGQITSRGKGKQAYDEIEKEIAAFTLATRNAAAKTTQG